VDHRCNEPAFRGQSSWIRWIGAAIRARRWVLAGSGRARVPSTGSGLGTASSRSCRLPKTH